MVDLKGGRPLLIELTPVDSHIPTNIEAAIIRLSVKEYIRLAGYGMG